MLQVIQRRKKQKNLGENVETKRKQKLKGGNKYNVK